MLLNLSNHPLSKWSHEQREAAEKQFGTVEDIPFPQLDPAASLESIREIVQQYVWKCEERIAENTTTESNAVHLMGEFTFTYLFVKEMEPRGILCVASTTERIVTENPDGSKTTVFKFVQFRPYFVANS
ncbi:MAG: CRISPR-associated protein [Bacteroidetes bacterium]|nr:CRISPR-associated protein [Bacteroidota bacterium]MCW5897535.1 CRISPR-associated protein [Bacteroidota bacterium]